MFEGMHFRDPIFWEEGDLIDKMQVITLTFQKNG
jgi:hypothetical protein